MDIAELHSSVGFISCRDDIDIIELDIRVSFS
jgi:hypothetical protein